MTEIEELLAPLAPTEPTDEEIARILVRADARKRRRRLRITAGAGLATAAATAAFAALPASDETGPPVSPLPATASAILRTSAAVAAEQPAQLAPWTGYRYIQEAWLKTQFGATVERTEEVWADSEWQGRRLSPRAKVVAGELPPYRPAPKPPADVQAELDRHPIELSARAQRILAEAAKAATPHPEMLLEARDTQTPRDMPNLYGDASLARAPLSELPTDPKRLATLLLESHKDGRWSLDGQRRGWAPLPSAVKYEVLRSILTLLTIANVTPDQRSALITVLSNYDGVTPLPAVKDHRGREGRGVEIPAGEHQVRVIFAPETAELLEWSEPNEVHTYLRWGHVAEIGERS